MLANLADDVEVVDDLVDEGLIELLLRRLGELDLTDDRRRCEKMIDAESVRVVAGPV